MLHYVLVVDDDPETRRQLWRVLTEARYAVREAENGADALGLVAQVRPDLVFLDMDMPVMDGWAFAAKLLSLGIELPMVVMTADGTAHTAAAKLGAIGYLSKPFHDSEVLRAMSPLGAAWAA